MTTLVILAALASALGGVALGARLGRRDSHALAPTVAEELRRLAEEQRARADEERDHAVRAAVEHLGAVQQHLVEHQRAVGAQELRTDRALIGERLDEVRGQIEAVRSLVGELERDREHKFGELAGSLARQHRDVAELADAARSLREALSSSRARGQWGERMAEDVLRLAGLLEGVNYRKQRAIEGGGIPDFTFLMPDDRVMHMDVKFPLDNYLRAVEATSELEARAHRDRFLRDVRDRVRELSRRDYGAARSSVDCVLLFIPNEQVYAFVQEHGRDLIDEALRQKVVPCSPSTLYAVVAVVRQAVDHFRVEQASREILGLLESFDAEWQRYVGAVDKVGRQVESVTRAFDELTGPRRRQLDRVLLRIEAVRTRALPAADDVTADPVPIDEVVLEA